MPAADLFSFGCTRNVSLGKIWYRYTTIYPPVQILHRYLTVIFSLNISSLDLIFILLFIIDQFMFF